MSEYDRRAEDREFKKKITEYFQKVDEVHRAVMGWTDPVHYEHHPGLVQLMEEKRKWRKWGGIVLSSVVAISTALIIFFVQQTYMESKKSAEQRKLEQTKWHAVRRTVMRDPDSGKLLYGWLEEVEDPNKKPKAKAKKKPRPAAPAPPQKEGTNETDSTAVTDPAVPPEQLPADAGADHR